MLGVGWTLCQSNECFSQHLKLHFPWQRSRSAPKVSNLLFYKTGLFFLLLLGSSMMINTRVTVDKWTVKRPRPSPSLEIFNTMRHCWPWNESISQASMPKSCQNVSKCFKMYQKSCQNQILKWRHLNVILMSFWRHLYVILVVIWTSFVCHFGRHLDVIFESFWNHFVAILLPFRCHFFVILMSFWCHFDVILMIRFNKWEDWRWELMGLEVKMKKGNKCSFLFLFNCFVFTAFSTKLVESGFENEKKFHDKWKFVINFYIFGGQERRIGRISCRK